MRPPMSRAAPLTRGLSGPEPSPPSSHTFCPVPGSSSVMTIDRPSGDQSLGFLNTDVEWKNGCSGAASPTLLTKKFSAPSRSLLKITFDPSGDQTGESLRPAPLDSGVAPPRARSASHRLDSDG